MKLRKRTIITIILMLVLAILTVSFFKDVYLTVIVSILSFLLLYKIFDYVANFKTLKNKSRIDILFLFIFFVWLFIPMSNISQKDFLYLEGRPRKEWQSLFQNKKINYNFGYDFNKWFEDRFFLRDDLVKFFNQVSILLLQKNSQGFIDKDWLYRGLYKSNATTTDDFDALIQLNDFCNHNNIKLYVLIVPDKNDIYFSKKNNVLINKSHNDFLSLVNNYKNQVRIIYPYSEMMNTKDKMLLYFKTEHHWTDDGAFIGYQELMKVIQKDFPIINVQSKEDYNYFYNNLVRGDFNRKFNNGTTCDAMTLSKKQYKKYHKTPYRYYRHRKYDLLNIQSENISKHLRKMYYYPFGSDLKVLLLGTSQSENLCEFVPYTFKQVKRLRNNNVMDIPGVDNFKIMKYYKQEILDYHPDILIFCITRGNTSRIRDLFNME